MWKSCCERAYLAAVEFAILGPIEVRRDGRSFLLVDLDSTNGIEVGGKRVKRLELSDGSRFTIGSTEIAFSEELA